MELSRIVLLLAACLTGSCSAPGGAGPTSRVEPVWLGPPPSPGGAPAGAGRVTVKLSAASYARGEAIRFSIDNGLPTTLYAEDSQSACEVALLERRTAGAWEALWGCSFERAPALVAIPAGGRRQVAIDPSSPHLQPFRRPDEPAVGPGTYRIRFSYRLDPGSLAGEQETAVSASFEIRR